MYEQIPICQPIPETFHNKELSSYNYNLLPLLNAKKHCIQQAPAGFFQGIHLSQESKEAENVFNIDFVENQKQIATILKKKPESSVWHRLAPKFKELIEMFDDNTDESDIARFEKIMDTEIISAKKRALDSISVNEKSNSRKNNQMMISCNIPSCKRKRTHGSFM